MSTNSVKMRRRVFTFSVLTESSSSISTPKSAPYTAALPRFTLCSPVVTSSISRSTPKSGGGGREEGAEVEEGEEGEEGEEKTWGTD